MLRIFSEMFEVMTFYRPIKALAEEGRGFFSSALALAAVFAAFSVVIAAVTAAMAFFSSGQFGETQLTQLAGQLTGKSLLMAVLFALVFAEAIIGTLFVFAFSRLFSNKGSIEELLGINFFILASASGFALVYFVPFSQFAGIIFLFLGVVLYLYFLNEAFEAMLGVSHGKSMVLLLLYFIVPAVLLAAGLWATGQIGKLPLPAIK